MTVELLKIILDQRPEGQNLLGMDVGKKTIGLALADSSHTVATPLKTIKRSKFLKDLKEIEAVVRQYNTGGFVIGYPLNMDGSEGPRCQSVRDFALELERQISDDLFADKKALWIALWDERLSTVSVEGFVDEVVDMKKRRAKEKGILDKLAAQHILQGALDYMHRPKV